MMIRAFAVALSVAIAVGVTAPAHAQRSDLSGTWALRVDSTVARTVAATGDAAFAKGDMGVGWGSPLTIVHTRDRLTVTYDAFTAYDLQPKVRLVYALDGSESRNAVAMGGAPPSRSTVAWQDASLVITTAFAAPAGVRVAPEALAMTQTLTLDASGRLTIVARRMGAKGTANTVVATYVRR
jgi:hypothetical protein